MNEGKRERSTQDSDHFRPEIDSNSQNMTNEDREFVNVDKTTPFRRINGTVAPSVMRETNLEEKRESQRQNVIALIVIFISSILVMAMLFYNFPELDE